MRVTASREELEYLTSIETCRTHASLARDPLPSARRKRKPPVAPACSPSVMPAATPPTVAPVVGSAPSRPSPQSSIGQGWAIAIVIIVALLAIARCALGQAPAPVAEAGPPAPTAVSEPQRDWNGLARRIEVLDGALLGLQAQVESLPTRSTLAAVAGQVEALRAEMTRFKDGWRIARAEDARHVGSEIARFEKRIAAMELAQRVNAAEQGRALDALARRFGIRIEAEQRAQAAAIQQALAEQAADTGRVHLVLSIAVAVLALGLLLAGTRVSQPWRLPLSPFARRTRDALPASTKCSPSRLPERPPPSGGAAGTAPNASVHALDETLPSPATYTRNIVNAAANRRSILFKPKAPSGRWGLALATAQGHVRPNNQDYGLAFSIRGRNVLIVTDGCGGTPRGQRAAFVAATSAAESLVRSLGTAKPFCAPSAQKAALRAILDAASALAGDAAQLDVSGTSGGLRTTAIVAIADRKRREIGYAYIGDGGAVLLHPTGEVQSFLEPQRIGSALAASLGPQTVGEPVSGTLPWPHGAMVLVGTDGVFDRVESTFPNDVLRACIGAEGDLQRTAEQAIAELAAFQDRDGYVADDNLTLGIIADGAEPKIGRDPTRPAEPAATTASPGSLAIQA